MPDVLNSCPLQMSHSATQRSYLKDIQQLYRTIETSTDGQASILCVGEMSVVISLHPKSGYNAHAAFTVNINCPVSYPREGPKVLFISPIFHPNIDNSSGSVCLNFLNEWLSCYNLLDVVKALLYLIEHPNFESTNNTFGYLENTDLLVKKTMRLLAGLPVNGQRFAPNQAWCEWAEAHGCLPIGEEEDDENDGASNVVEDVTQMVGVGDGQESGDEHDVVSDAVASVYKADVKEKRDGDAAVFDENVLSFANIRFSVGSETDSQSSPPYRRKYALVHIEMQRINIWNPTDSPNANTPSVFYFCELVGDRYTQMEFHSLYSTLFTGDVLRCMQSRLESRQTSSLCPWYIFYQHTHYSNHSSSTSVFDLSFLFTKKFNRPELTDDFCPWSHADGGGIWDILGSLFKRRRSSAPSTPSQDAVQGFDMAFLFNTSFEVEDSDVDKECGKEEGEDEKDEDNGMETLEVLEREEKKLDNLATSDKAASDLEENKPCYVDGNEDGGNGNTGVDDEEMSTYDQINLPEDTQTYESSRTYEMEPEVVSGLNDDGWIMNDYMWCVGTLNADMQPQWQWFFRQTRWPFRFAPQQKVDVSVHENRIPPWRASVGRLHLDVYNFCKQNRQMQNLILLNPLALSPLSPLLNLMRHAVEPKAHLTGILWMTPLDALSPLYQVPIPRQDGNSEGEELKKHPYPRPLYLRFLTLGAFLSNWLAWFSRIETYSSLGISRFPPAAVSDPVAGCVLRPYSLGCGQSPLIDLWPLWLARRLPLLPCHLSLLCDGRISRHMFPFADLDEI
uniref:UBIQUITIN_CONJUGAT_2 domain-containing protein n=3 Tax=Mesocestoides corti TaxID=53468 RepID=A0A5K3FGU8_MESCO